MTKTRIKAEIGKLVFMFGIFFIFGIVAYLIEIYWLAIVGGVVAMGYYLMCPPAIHMAISNGWDDSEVIELINDKTNIREKDRKGNTALHIAARCDRSSLIKKFIDLGADVNAQNKRGNTPLHWVVNFDARDAAKILIGYGKADAYLKNSLGMTPMLRAEAYENHEMIRILTGDE